MSRQKNKNGKKNRGDDTASLLSSIPSYQIEQEILRRLSLEKKAERNRRVDTKQKRRPELAEDPQILIKKLERSLKKQEDQAYEGHRDLKLGEKIEEWEKEPYESDEQGQIDASGAETLQSRRLSLHDQKTAKNKQVEKLWRKKIQEEQRDVKPADKDDWKAEEKKYLAYILEENDKRMRRLHFQTVLENTTLLMAFAHTYLKIQESRRSNSYLPKIDTSSLSEEKFRIGYLWESFGGGINVVRLLFGTARAEDPKMDRCVKIARASLNNILPDDIKQLMDNTIELRKKIKDDYRAAWDAYLKIKQNAPEYYAEEFKEKIDKNYSFSGYPSLNLHIANEFDKFITRGVNEYTGRKKSMKKISTDAGSTPGM